MPCISAALRPISWTISGWKITAAITASTTERLSTIIAGSLRAIITPVSSGTIRSQGVIWNLAEITLVYIPMSAGVSGMPQRPITVNAISAITKDGTVVISM